MTPNDREHDMKPFGEPPKRDEESVEPRYLAPGEVEFYKTEGGLLGLRLSGEDAGRVGLFRMFPLHGERRYISVREEKRSRHERGGEIGIITSIDDYSPKQLALIEEELSRRYFTPEIISVKSVREEFGHTYWETETTAGERKFTVFDLNQSVLNLGRGRVMIIDVDGNRYLFPDISKAGDKALKQLDIWL